MVKSKDRCMFAARAQIVLFESQEHGCTNVCSKSIDRCICVE